MLILKVVNKNNETNDLIYKVISLIYIHDNKYQVDANAWFNSFPLFYPYKE